MQYVPEIGSKWVHTKSTNVYEVVALPGLYADVADYMKKYLRLIVS